MFESYKKLIQTPKEAIDILFPYLNKRWKIWECACGKGNLHNAFLKNGFEIVATDILQGVNFLGYSFYAVDHQFDCIITNPPYSLKGQFLEKCFEIGKALEPSQLKEESQKLPKRHLLRL